MQPIQLFALASRQAEWLSVRQEVVASNIANANTPKYLRQGHYAVQTWSWIPRRSAVWRAPIPLISQQVNWARISRSRRRNVNNEIGVQESGNTVALSEELTKAGDIRRQHDLNTSLVTSFHRMMLMAVKK